MPEVELARRAVRDLDLIREPDLSRVETRILALAHDPRPPGVKKLKENLHRVRVGDWRILYEIEDRSGIVRILRVVRRSEKTYRGL